MFFDPGFGINIPVPQHCFPATSIFCSLMSSAPLPTSPPPLTPWICSRPFYCDVFATSSLCSEIFGSDFSLCCAGSDPAFILSCGSRSCFSHCCADSDSAFHFGAFPDRASHNDPNPQYRPFFRLL